MTRRAQVAGACAKAILLGEHAVVYGVPAFAIPIRARRTRVQLRIGGGGLDLTCSRGYETTLARRMAIGAADAAGVDPRGVSIVLDSTIAPGAGLGSSASLAVALTRVFSSGSKIGVEEVARRANVLERIAHGTPSGIDATTIAHERPVWFQHGAELRFLATSVSLRFVVAVLPRAGTTAGLVARVRALREREPGRFTRFLDRSAELSARAERWFKSLADSPAAGGAGVLSLGAILSEAQEGLRDVGVSTAAQDTLCAALQAAGAVGVKLSGAGGGGATLALLPGEAEVGGEEAIMAAGRAAGAVECFVTEVLGEESVELRNGELS